MIQKYFRGSLHGQQFLHRSTLQQLYKSSRSKGQPTAPRRASAAGEAGVQALCARVGFTGTLEPWSGLRNC